jgi:hypothetical protein
VSTHYFRFSGLTARNRQRSALLERLLARADRSIGVADWRSDAFRSIAPEGATMPGIGATALYAEHGLVPGASVFVATPVHYTAEMSNVRMPADGILSLREADAVVLAADFNRVWHDAGVRLLAGRRAVLFCVADEALCAATNDPLDVLGRHIEDHLPTGAGAPRLRQLMSEIEMWLFEHAVNRERIENALGAVSGLWLWGGGAVLTAAPQVLGWAAGDDVFFNSLAWRNELPRGPGANTGARSGVRSGLPTGPDSGVAVVTAEPGTNEWREVESHWLARSIAELRSGRIARLDLSAGRLCYSVSPVWRWRLWRRPRPWWESFA